MDGCHVSIVILTVGAAGNSEDSHRDSAEFFTRCLERLNCDFQPPPLGLATSYFTILADSGVQQAIQCVSNSKAKSLIGRWHCLSTKQPNPRRVGGHIQATDELTPLESIIALLSSATGINLSPSATASWNKIATQIHNLLDKAPWKPMEHVLVDIHWLLAGSNAPSPSSALELYGSLLRLQEWYGGHIQLVCNSDQDNCDFQDWREVLQTPPVRSLSDWLSGQGVFWRGALHFTQHKVPKLGQLSSMAFPGFALALRSDMPEEDTSPAAFEAVGLVPGLGHPSHLEVIQPVSLASFPLFWRSSLHCTLFLANTAFQNSAVVMEDLLMQKSNKSVALLVKLCFKEGKETQTHRDTADWIAYVQEKEEPETALRRAQSPSPLESYLPGPLLLLCPSEQSNSSSLSCDAWFLWKSEYLSGTVLASTQAVQIAADDSDDESELLLPFSLDPIVMATTYPMEDFWDRLSTLPLELDHPPSEWPEMKALQTHEWIQRKVIHRLVTPDLMFGQMVAPPPSATKATASVGDLLTYFKDSGAPVVSALSPIAMSEPSTRIHDPGEGTISFETIAASTPSSKKNYHGVNYCLSSADTSMDSRLTRVQQRYLISERASNCSSPRAERKRKRRASQISQNNSTDGKKAISGATVPSPLTKIKKGRPKLASRELKSPMIKLCRSKATSTAHARKIGRVTAQRGSRKEQSASNLRPDEKADQESKPSTQSKVSTARRGVAEDVGTKSLCTQEPQSNPPRPQDLRRSPRVKKLKMATEKGDEHSTGPPDKPSSSRDSEGKKLRTSPRKLKLSPTKKKPESNKKRLERIIVSTLKKNNMPRSHPCFRKCYTRLFNLSKIFLKDIKSCGGLEKEMERVVNCNVVQVIDFEQRQAGLTDPSATVE